MSNFRIKSQYSRALQHYTSIAPIKQSQATPTPLFQFADLIFMLWLINFETFDYVFMAKIIYEIKISIKELRIHN